MAAAVVLTQSVSLSTQAGFGYQARGVITLSPSPATYTTGGIVFNLNNNPLVKATRGLKYCYVTGISGYIYAYVNAANTSSATGLLKIFVQDGTAGNPLAELANGLAIPAGVSNDTIHWWGIWAGME